MKVVRLVLAALCAASLSACSTVPNPYIPQTIGSLQDSEKADWVEVRIDTDTPLAVIGQPITFKIAVRNISTHDLWVPRDPGIAFNWTYPDGRRDSMLNEAEAEHFYTTDDAVRLPPKHQLVKYVTVKTYYFQRPGITEFRATYSPSANTNPTLQPFWSEPLSSNAYGVQIQKGRVRADFASYR